MTESHSKTPVSRPLALGDQSALAQKFEGKRERLRNFVRSRMHSRLQTRVDPSDILQKAYLQAAKELPRYVQNPKLPFTLWLRTIAWQKLTELHRHHLGV